MSYPILEFDGNSPEIFLPKACGTFPKRCVASFFGDIVETYAHHEGTVEIGRVKWESHPVIFYQTIVDSVPVMFFQIPVGAPLAVGLLEDAIASGTRAVIACGGCGVLDRNLSMGDILVPTHALRDEGTSFHYMAPSRFITLQEETVAHVLSSLQEWDVPHQICKTWTTDGVYRETKERMKRRKEEGCLAVEMECAALSACAQFRHVQFAQMLYSGDQLDGSKYDTRSWQRATDVRAALFSYALHCVATLPID